MDDCKEIIKVGFEPGGRRGAWESAPFERRRMQGVNVRSRWFEVFCRFLVYLCMDCVSVLSLICLLKDRFCWYGEGIYESEMVLKSESNRDLCFNVFFGYEMRLLVEMGGIYL